MIPEKGAQLNKQKNIADGKNIDKRKTRRKKVAVNVNLIGEMLW